MYLFLVVTSLPNLKWVSRDLFFRHNFVGNLFGICMDSLEQIILRGVEIQNYDQAIMSIYNMLDGNKHNYVNDYTTDLFYYSKDSS